jgi:hypothetical protein
MVALGSVVPSDKKLASTAAALRTRAEDDDVPPPAITAPLPPPAVLQMPEPEALSVAEPTAEYEGTVEIWEEIQPADRVPIVWEILIGKGSLPEDEAIRLVATELRHRRQLSYERLREGGLIFKTIQAAIEQGAREGLFDKPARGYRRAIVSEASEIPDFVLAEQITELLDEMPAGLGPSDLTHAIIHEMRQRVGLVGWDNADAPIARLVEVMVRSGDLRRTTDSGKDLLRLATGRK